MPLQGATLAAHAVLARAGLQSSAQLDVIELHDAFAVQGLAFCQALELAPTRVNRRGGGLARGHPIAASGAIALVRMLSDLQRDGAAGAWGMATIAAAGGLGAATLIERLAD